MSVEKLKNNADHLTSDGELERNKKSSRVLLRILKEYPWPIKKERKCKAGRPNVKVNIIQHDLDEDIIGEGSDEGGLSFRKGFGVLSDILNVYSWYNFDSTRVYISCLAGVTLKKDEHWSSFLDELGICITSADLADENADFYGDYYTLTVNRELQDDLLKKLTVIKSRFDAFEACDSEIQDNNEIIADLVDVYRGNIPTSDLMSLIDGEPPPIGYLTTMLLINWRNKRAELSYTPSWFGPLNDYIFLKWLAKGRQKEIMTNLRQNITYDIEVSEICEYLIKLSTEYVNEKEPSFGGPYGAVERNRYKYNKELFAGFYTGSFPRKPQCCSKTKPPEELQEVDDMDIIKTTR